MPSDLNMDVKKIPSEVIESRKKNFFIATNSVIPVFKEHGYTLLMDSYKEVLNNYMQSDNQDVFELFKVSKEIITWGRFINDLKAINGLVLMDVKTDYDKETANKGHSLDVVKVEKLLKQSRALESYGKMLNTHSKLLTEANKYITDNTNISYEEYTYKSMN